LDRAGRSIVELAARDDPGIAVDDFVHVDRSLEPGMPRVRHHRLVPAAPGTTRPMSVLSSSCTTMPGRTLPWPSSLPPAA